MNYLLMMMGGSGVRFGADIPKQYIEDHGEPVFAYTLRKYNEIDLIDKIIIISNPAWLEYSSKVAKSILADKLLSVISGGKTRSHSVRNGLMCCHKTANDNDLILIHDATNPFVDASAVRKAIASATAKGAAVVGTNQYHTIYSKKADNTIESFIPRETVGSGYSPEVFKLGIIFPSYEKASDAQLEEMTSTLSLALQYGVDAVFVPANIVNLKITYSHDMNAFIALKRAEKEADEYKLS